MEKIRELLENRAVAVVFAGGLGTLALTGCGGAGEAEILPNRPAAVLSHSYDDADTSFMMAGKVPIVTYDDEHFFLEVKQCDRSGDTHADEQGCVTDMVEVDEATYDAHPDGSQITFEEQ
jgi:hypothetical protein